MLLASGDGGWSGFEEKIGGELASRGFRVVCWDCQKYAALGSYDRKLLSTDMIAAIQAAGVAGTTIGKPLILAGYSTGAEQVVAVASGPWRPPQVAGLLLISPGWRGRYGISLCDRMGLPPKGSDTFSLQDLSSHLENLRIYQIHGEHDPLDQTAWLQGLKVPHKLAVYPDGWHLFKGGPPDFLTMVAKGTAWILHE